MDKKTPGRKYTSAFPGEEDITEETADEFREICYTAIGDIGVQNFLTCLMEATRHRAYDLAQEGDRRGELLHNRAMIQIAQTVGFIYDDYAEVDRIVTEEEKTPRTLAQKLADEASQS